MRLSFDVLPTRARSCVKPHLFVVEGAVDVGRGTEAREGLDVDLRG